MQQQVQEEHPTKTHNLHDYKRIRRSIFILTYMHCTISQEYHIIIYSNLYLITFNGFYLCAVSM